MSGPGRVPDWPAIARALAASGCDLTEYGESPAAPQQLRIETETAAEDIRNALQLLQNAERAPSYDGKRMYDAWALDVEAIEARLWSAVRKLEAK